VSKYCPNSTKAAEFFLSGNLGYFLMMMIIIIIIIMTTRLYRQNMMQQKYLTQRQIASADFDSNLMRK